MEDDPPSFDDPVAEARHYRLLSKDLQDELEDLKLALSDFQASSKELEDEMEKEMAATEKRETELRTESERLRGEVESLKSRHQSSLREQSTTLSHMQKELESLRAIEKTLRGKLRDMELDNDDLEKNERAISSTLEDMENRYNKSVERTALLEQELVDKARIEEELQRTKDELRETMEEMGVLRTQLAEALAASRAHAAYQASTPGRAHDLRLASQYSNEVPSPDNDSEGSVSGKDQSSVPTPIARSRTRSVIRLDNDSPQIAFVRASPSKIPTSTLSPDSPSTTLFASETLRDVSPTPNPLARSSNIRNLSSLASRKSITPKAVRDKRADGMISDMKSMTTRMQNLTALVNNRRESMVVGSAIPRPRSKPGGLANMAELTNSASSSSISSLTRTASSRVGMVNSPTMSSVRRSEEYRQPARPISRAGQNRSTGIFKEDSSDVPRQRPASRLSSISHSRPVTPMMSTRSPTPSSQYGSVGLGASSAGQAGRAPRRVSVGPGNASATARRTTVNRPKSQDGGALTQSTKKAPALPSWR